MQYPVVPRNEYSRPTAVMLSHVYGAKDIVTAIKAAQVIISQYGVSGETSSRHRRVLPVHVCWNVKRSVQWSLLCLSGTHIRRVHVKWLCKYP